MKTKILLFIFSVILSAQVILADTVVYGLKTEGLTNPSGVVSMQPRFSWKIKDDVHRNLVQKAYQIVVSSSSEKLSKNEFDVWNSGKVKSAEQLWVPFLGKSPKTKSAYFWKVKVWTNENETPWSETAFWNMGLLSENDWQAQWIGLDKAMPWDSETQWSRLSARYLRKEFQAQKQIKRAMAYVSGLGLYELYINGVKAGNQVLAPAPTDYRESVLYNSLDVTDLLQKGSNAIGVVLGNGRYYTMRQGYKPYKIVNFGYPKLKMNLTIEYMDGTTEVIVSNGSWKLTADGPVRSNNEYDGEIYDATKELTGWNKVGYDDSSWKAAERVSIPAGTLRPQLMPGMQVVDELKIKSMNVIGNKIIIDLGQNMAGWAKIKVKGNAGDTVQLRFAEILQPNGELYVENLRDALATDTYILKGDVQGEEWHPVFVYHGFRYVEISGLKKGLEIIDVVGQVVNDVMENTGNLLTSNDMLNQILKNARWGIQGNYKGMPVDCPQRNERQPWLGDRSMGCWGESYIFDNSALYTKWGQDIREAQREDGCIPDVAPAYWNYYSDNVSWPSALPMLCDMIYTQFGNVQPIKDNYPAIRKWLKHLQTEYMTPEYIIPRDEYGDWCVPPEKPEMIHSRDPRRQTDGALISTAYFYNMLVLMQKFADLQGMNLEKQEYAALGQKVKNAFHQKFFHADSLFYGNNSATSNLLPLAFGMIPDQFVEAVKKNIIQNIASDNMPAVKTGVIGIQWLMRELSKMGRADVAFALATTDKYPSWGYMASKGATTIWELWNGDTASPKMNSGNHVMLLGDLLPWAYENLGGIKSDSKQVAFKHIIMQPDFSIPDISFADASLETPYGKIISSWKKDLIALKWHVEIPVNTSAALFLPDGQIKKIGSGIYDFETRFPQTKGITANEFVYEKADFPQCHSATIVETTGGDLLTAFFGGTREGHPDVCIYVSRKNKGDVKWSVPALAADGVFPDGSRKACYNPVLYQMQDGPLVLFYKVGNRVSDWKGYMKMSTDGGYSWGKARELPEGYLGPIKNKIVDVDGKSIAPASTEGNGWKVYFEIAENGGRSIRKVGPLEAGKATLTQDMIQGSTNEMNDIEGGDNSSQNTIQAIQPSILVHKDGRLQILCRTRNGKLATAWSSDRGENWSALELTNVPNNNSGTDAVTLKDGRHLLVYNNIETPAGAKKGPRSPLNIAISDNGVDWKMIYTLEDSPVSQYSYPAVIQTSDGKVHIVYTWRRQRIKHIELTI